MLLLCRFHHCRFHEAAYRIAKVGNDFRFETNDGHVIGAAPTGPPPEPESACEETARAQWGGAKPDYDHLMFVIGDAFVPN